VFLLKVRNLPADIKEKEVDVGLVKRFSQSWRAFSNFVENRGCFPFMQFPLASAVRVLMLVLLKSWSVPAGKGQPKLIVRVMLPWKTACQSQVKYIFSKYGTVRSSDAGASYPFIL